jgi:hypothetical protein
MNKNNTFKLGRSITQIIPFYRQPQQQQKEIITSKLVITMVIIGNNSDSKDRCLNIMDLK